MNSGPELSAFIAATGLSEQDASALMRRLLDRGYILAPLKADGSMFMRGGNVSPSSGNTRSRTKRIGDLAARDAWSAMIRVLIVEQFCDASLGSLRAYEEAGLAIERSSQRGE